MINIVRLSKAGGCFGIRDSGHGTRFLSGHKVFGRVDSETRYRLTHGGLSLRIRAGHIVPARLQGLHDLASLAVQQLVRQRFDPDRRPVCALPRLVWSGSCRQRPMIRPT